MFHFWGRPSTPLNRSSDVWSHDDNQLNRTTTEWSSKGLRPGTAPATTSPTKQQYYSTMVSEKSSSTTISSVLPHAAAPDFRSGLSSAGTNRDSFSRGELDRSDPSSLSMPSLMDLVDPDREQGSKGARKGAKKIARGRGRHRRGTATSGSTHAQKKSKRNGSSSLQRTSTSRQRRWRKQERSKSPTRKKRKSSKTKRRKAEKAKIKLPSTAPAGRSRRSTMGPLVESEKRAVFAAVGP